MAFLNAKVPEVSNKEKEIEKVDEQNENPKEAKPKKDPCCNCGLF